MRPLAYVAGRYSAQALVERDANIEAAGSVARDLLALGYAPICPHKNTAGFELDGRFTWQDFIDMDLAILLHCHLLVCVQGWCESKGACLEVARARELGLPVFMDIADVPPAAEFDVDVQSLAATDLLQRSVRGVATYGRRLYPFNGRDARGDLYEELLDAVVYARQVREENGGI